MGVAKKEKSRKERQGKVGDGMNNVKVKGENFYRYSLEMPDRYGGKTVGEVAAQWLLTHE